MGKSELIDSDFNLWNIDENCIFNALKLAVIKVIKTFNGYENVDVSSVNLNPQYTIKEKFFGKDKNLYHRIILDVSVKTYLTHNSFNLFIEPFEIKIAPSKYGAQPIGNENLTQSFSNFMLKQFPKAEYTKKRQEYFAKTKICEKVETDLLFSK